MPNYKNVTPVAHVLPETVVTEKSGQVSLATRFAQGAVISSLVASSAVFADVPTIDTADLLGYLGVLLAAVATVGSLGLMVHFTAKGLKTLKSAW